MTTLLRTVSQVRRRARGFTLPDLLAVMAGLVLLVAIAVPLIADARGETRKRRCIGNLQRVTTAVLLHADAFGDRLPDAEPGAKGPLWWSYKEQVKPLVGLKGPPSPADKVFACPSDRGYEERKPFRSSAKFFYGSYVYNGVNLPGLPHVAGRPLESIRDPSRTLLVMEWTAHAPLSWHKSLTGRRNFPFYNDAESVLGFVDGRVDFLPIYYDGINPAYTRDPIPGYGYKYSAD